MEKECINCGKQFVKPQSDSKKVWSVRKFCSRDCKSESQKGKAFYSPIGNTYRRGKSQTVESRKKMSDAHTGKKRGSHTLEHRFKISQSQKGEKGFWYGKQMSEETKQKMRENYGNGFGEENSNWKGGETPLYHLIRHSSKYREWRQQVFERDRFKCRECDKGGKIEAHHTHSFIRIIRKFNIKTFEQAMGCGELWDLKNGKTLCIDCHSKFHKINGK